MTKSELRKELRKTRRDHVAAQPASIRALLFNRPPAPLLELIADTSVVGLYHSTADEAPTASYAKFFYERGHRLALPRFPTEQSDMEFAEFTDPFEESDIVAGAFGMKQPVEEASLLDPDIVFIPLVGFTDTGARLGQGGGHYDKWLASHSDKTKIGLAWDAQRVDALPEEAHDQRLDAIVTPTRLYGPFQ